MGFILATLDGFQYVENLSILKLFIFIQPLVGIYPDTCIKFMKVKQSIYCHERIFSFSIIFLFFILMSIVPCIK